MLVNKIDYVESLLDGNSFDFAYLKTTPYRNISRAKQQLKIHGYFTNFVQCRKRIRIIYHAFLFFATAYKKFTLSKYSQTTPITNRLSIQGRKLNEQKIEFSFF